MAEHAQPDRRSKLTDAEAPGRAGVQLMLPADGRTAKNDRARAARLQDGETRGIGIGIRALHGMHCIACLHFRLGISVSVLLVDDRLHCMNCPKP